MKILFYFNHPAHFHLFKELIKILKKKHHKVIIVIKKKDVLEELVLKEGWSYYNVYPKNRRNSKAAIALSLLERNLKVARIAISEKPDIMLGTSVEITHIGKLLSIPSIMVNEDDAEQIGYWAKISYPFASAILAPGSCSVGKWKSKTVFYNGYHELAYLHPSYFKPDLEKVKEMIFENKPFFLLRFAKLNAHHDKGKTGITGSLASLIIKKLKEKGEVFISSERELEHEFEQYRINIHPSLIHHTLAFALLYIGDSQTMAAEAAVLGTPSLRFNDFVGKLGYLEELEHRYKLTYGISTDQPDVLLQKIDELLSIPDVKEVWKMRKEVMLSEKIDVTSFMVWFVENYPESFNLMQTSPEYQIRFRPESRDVILK